MPEEPSKNLPSPVEDTTRILEREAAQRRVSEGERPWQEEQPGVQSVVDAVRDVQFPKTLQEIEAEVGNREVKTSKETLFPLSYVLTKLEEPEFRTFDDFKSAVIRHWQGIEHLELPPEERPTGGFEGDYRGPQ